MKETVNGVTVVYIGSYYEWSGTPSTMVSYYYAGIIRIAMRIGSGPGATGLSWLVGDHLGSTSVVADNNGASVGGVTYKPWGEGTTWGTVPTKRLFTGQILEATLGLYFFNARWYDSSLGRFIQPDTIVPNLGNPKSFDRYSFTLNSPVNFIDPSGHTSVGTCTLYQDGECVWRVNGTELDRYRALIYAEYGVVLVDTGSNHGNGAGAKAWDLVSVKQVYDALGIIDDNLGGHLNSLIGGSTFTSNKYDTEGKYHANTGNGYIDFKTGGVFPTSYINIFHEVGHLIDANSPGGNYFSTALKNADHTWIAQNGKINRDVLFGDVSDPYWTTPQDALQGTDYQQFSLWKLGFKPLCKAREKC